jgi:phospholipid/cholesterol/gamma-HCH transport system substrate-binding protein
VYGTAQIKRRPAFVRNSHETHDQPGSIMSRQARVGLLVIAGVLLFFVSLFAIANRSFLFSDTFFIRSEFGSVAGLQSGASVQFQGVNVGRVETVSLPDRPGGKISVTMAIRQDARHLIRTSTQAQIKSDGLVGNQIVVLVNPPQADVGEEVEEGDVIPGVDPFDPFEVADDMVASVQRFEQAALTFEQIMLDVKAGEGTLGKVIYDPELYNSFVQTTNETQRLMHTLGDNAQALVALAEQATEGLNSILTKIDRGEGTLAKMINDPAVYDMLLASADTLKGISTDLRGITTSAENAANWGALGMYRLAQNMEALRHNFLFKRYYEERGYMEPAEFEVRERAIEQTYRALQQKERELLDLERALQSRLAEQARNAAADSLGGKLELPTDQETETIEASVVSKE